MKNRNRIRSALALIALDAPTPTESGRAQNLASRAAVPAWLRSRTAGAIKLLVVMLLWTVPAVVQAQFTYTTNNGTIAITGYTGPGGAVAIPSTITELPVTSIGVYAFRECGGLTSVTIPNSVTTIGDDAFYYCTNLTSVTIPNSVISIGYSAFFQCRSLTSVTISTNVTSIGAGAFFGCYALTNVTIPSSVNNIEEGAFSFCQSMKAITVSAANSAYTSVDGVLFNKNQTTLVQFPAGKAGSYPIPDSVINIGNLAFGSCTNLTSVTIPTSVTRIGDWAFAGCSLTSITIPNSVTNIGDYAFVNCYALTNVTIPNSVTSLGDGAFHYCASLASVTIPNSVTNIAPDAFGFCTSLTEVYFQGNAPIADSYVFNGTDNATVYYLPGTTGWGPTFGGRPTALWSLPNPLILAGGTGFGAQTNGFGFIISWAANNDVVVEASTDLANPSWIALQTNTLTSGSSYFSDPQWTNYPARFYRLRAL